MSVMSRHADKYNTLLWFTLTQVLSAELDDDGRMKMKLVCDEDEDNQISVTELCKAFPRSTSLVEQVGACVSENSCVDILG